MHDLLDAIAEMVATEMNENGRLCPTFAVLAPHSSTIHWYESTRDDPHDEAAVMSVARLSDGLYGVVGVWLEARHDYSDGLPAAADRYAVVCSAVEGEVDMTWWARRWGIDESGELRWIDDAWQPEEPPFRLTVVPTYWWN